MLMNINKPIRRNDTGPGSRRTMQRGGRRRTGSLAKKEMEEKGKEEGKRKERNRTYTKRNAERSEYYVSPGIFITRVH